MTQTLWLLHDIICDSMVVCNVIVTAANGSSVPTGSLNPVYKNTATIKRITNTKKIDYTFDISDYNEAIIFFFFESQWYIFKEKLEKQEKQNSSVLTKLTPEVDLQISRWAS